MTIKRVREIFGKKVTHLTDKEISFMIARDTQMIQSLFTVFDKFLTTDKNIVNNGVKA